LRTKSEQEPTPPFFLKNQEEVNKMKIMDRELIIQLVVGVLFATFIGYALDLWTIPPFMVSLAMFLGAMIGVAIIRYWILAKKKRKAKRS